jgi:CheY-like chemotaxis protein
VKNLVEMHGGSIEARSAGLNQGSEFIVRLPVAVAPRADLANASASSTDTVAPPRRILVVDDNVDAARALGLVLRVLGHDVRVVFSSEDCLKALETFVPEVLFLDIGLPGMDGYEVARAVRRLPGMDELFLVALTGYGREEDRRKTREAGFDYHLVKPAGMQDVQLLLATLAPLVPSASSTSPRGSRSSKRG